MIVLWDVRSGVGRPTLVFVEFVETADVDDGIFDTTTPPPSRRRRSIRRADNRVNIPSRCAIAWFVMM